MAVGALLGLAKEGLDLFRQVEEGKISAADAAAAHEAQILALDSKIADNQAEVVKIDAQSDRLIQWVWRPVVCIALWVATLSCPFTFILDAWGAFDLTPEQKETLLWVMVNLLPYGAAAMGLREYGKHRRANKALGVIAGIVK